LDTSADGNVRLPPLYFKIDQRTRRLFTLSDAVVLIVLAILIYAGARIAAGAPQIVEGPAISLAPATLPWYGACSLGRMLVAYILSLTFSLFYGYSAVHRPQARKVLMPLLDVLQSVPLLSFLPIALLSLSAFLPEKLAAELASIILIFTSQAWNLTFSWYQSLITVPSELQEAGSVFRFNGWLRFRTVQLPFAAVSLIWNSIMSWAGGWFFLMAAEIFTVGRRDFRLPGLGAYLQEAANRGNLTAVAWGLGTLIFIIVGLDQLVWRPLLAWSERFKLEMVASERPRTSWFYDVLRGSRIIAWAGEKLIRPAGERLDGFVIRRYPAAGSIGRKKGRRLRPFYLLSAAAGAGILYGLYRTALMLLAVSAPQWGHIGLGLAATLARVALALAIALTWTIPLGVAIGTNPRVAAFLQPIVQIAASVPATALFPIFLLFMLHLPGGLNLVAVVLMLMGTQWYLLFNVIAGSASIPQDLKYATTLLNLRGWTRWRTLILPALFPYLITGAITAGGGAWNASIVAEHVEFAGRNLSTAGIGATIVQATAAGDYPLLLAATLSMVCALVLINRLLWRRLYRVASERYRME